MARALVGQIGPESGPASRLVPNPGLDCNL